MSRLGAVAALDEALKTHVAILATTGMGKSYLVRGVVERALDSGSERALIIDPKGVHYGIRLKRDGGMAVSRALAARASALQAPPAPL